MAKGNNSALGGLAFLVGVILAIILGLIGTLDQTWIVILVIIGIIVGLLNVGNEEATPFLMSGAVLIIASSLSQNAFASISWLNSILNTLLVIFVPATIVVAIKNVFRLARN